MPLYEYQCDSCGHRFELIRKFSDPPFEVCPECGKSPVRKLISAPGIHFKGTGWYITDYAKGSSSAAGSDSSSPTTGKSKHSEPKTEGKTEGKTESKAETKSGTKTESSGDSKPAAKPESK